jgi:hypothetical protein
MTLPHDVIQGLRQINTDLGYAVVTLVDAFGEPKDVERKRPIVDFVSVGRRRSLIVVDREAFRDLPGCELIPLSADRAFLSLEDGRTLPDLELSVVDRLADPALGSSQRQALEALRRALKECRCARDIEVEPRSILVVEKSNRSR